jgi:hypothetical protein
MISKASTFPHLQKKFQKITIIIDIAQACPKSQKSSIWVFGPLGVA